MADYYNCQTKNMRKCVENLLEWIGSAEHYVSMGWATSAWALLSREEGFPKWSVTVDGEQNCNLERALELLSDKANENADVKSTDFKIEERSIYMQEAFDACLSVDLKGVKHALKEFLDAE